MNVACLRDEDRREREIDRRAVEVERVAGRQYQADDALLAAELLELHQHARKNGLGRRRSQHDQ